MPEVNDDISTSIFTSLTQEPGCYCTTTSLSTQQSPTYYPILPLHFPSQYPDTNFPYYKMASLYGNVKVWRSYVFSLTTLELGTEAIWTAAMYAAMKSAKQARADAAKLQYQADLLKEAARAARLKSGAQTYSKKDLEALDFAAERTREEALWQRIECCVIDSEVKGMRTRNTVRFLLMSVPVA